MIPELAHVFILGAVWGGIWAMFMQKTRVGWFISTRQTWLAVVLGCGGNLLILAVYLPLEQWLMAAAVFAGSAVPVAVRSLHNQNREIEETGKELWQQTVNLQAHDSVN
jgi:hypothetical protein